MKFLIRFNKTHLSLGFIEFFFLKKKKKLPGFYLGLWVGRKPWYTLRQWDWWRLLFHVFKEILLHYVKYIFKNLQEPILEIFFFFHILGDDINVLKPNTFTCHTRSHNMDLFYCVFSLSFPTFFMRWFTIKHSMNKILYPNSK